MKMHLTVDDIPKSWVSLLKEIQEHDPKAIIGGGCLRDLDHQLHYDGVPFEGEATIKDIDIFVSDGTILPQWTIHQITFSDPESAEHDSTISGQAHFRTGDIEYPINILYCKKDVIPAMRFSHFDFGLCQIAFDGSRIFVTDAYLTDRSEKTFTLLRASSSEAYQNSLDRFHRFQQRYRYYTLVNKFIDAPPTIK